MSGIQSQITRHAKKGQGKNGQSIKRIIKTDSELTDVRISREEHLNIILPIFHIIKKLSRAMEDLKEGEGGGKGGETSN